MEIDSPLGLPAHFASIAESIQSHQMKNDTPVNRREAFKPLAATLAGALIPAKLIASPPQPSTGVGVPLPEGISSIPDVPARLADNRPANQVVPSEPKHAMLVRSDDAAASWKRIIDSLTTELPLAPDGKSVLLTDKLLRIEAGFHFNSARNDTDYVWLQIEPLIDQAADLLDRGLQDRAIWDEMSIKYLDLLLELKEFAELDRIHQEEEAAGLYSTPWKESMAEHAAIISEKQGQEQAKVALEKLTSDFFAAQVKEQQSKALQGLAWLSGRAGYYVEGQTVKYFQHVWEGTTAEVSGLAQAATVTISGHSLNLQEATIGIQKASAQIGAEAATHRAGGLQIRVDWDKVNADFLRRRTLISRQLEEIKATATAHPNGVLNYSKRLTSLKGRFHNDFRDAIARIHSIQRGLRDIYGYVEPVPSDDTAVQFFDDCLLWTRNVIQWLIRFSRLEQNVVLPLSVRSLVGETEWRTGLAAGYWCFSLNESFLPEGCHVRLRGLSAFAEPSAGCDQVWRMSVVVPRCAIYRHLDSEVTVEVDQSIVPSIELGRVTSRESNREPDVAGASAAFNASPFGMWSVRVHSSVGRRRNGGSQKQTSKHPTLSLDDVYLDLALAFRARRNSTPHGHK